MASLCPICVTNINPNRPDHLREHLDSHLQNPRGKSACGALKARLARRLHRIGRQPLPLFLAGFILRNTTNISTWRNSADVYELESHTANDGRNRDGNRHAGRCANTGSATRNARSGSRACDSSCDSPRRSSDPARRAHLERWPHGHQRLHRRLLQREFQPA